ncbi:MAG TPA: flagellar motor protein MotB [Candidatus Binatia bacterium]|jgi:chemotaxis protein MotB
MLRKGSRKAKGVEEKTIVVKKLRPKHEVAHTGAWKVAYADFVTSMMALFIVLWIVSSGDPELKAGVARYFRDPAVFDSSRGFVPIQQQEEEFISLEGNDAFKDLQEALQQDLKRLKEYAAIEGQISVRLTSEGLVIELVDTDSQAFFDLSSAELKPVLRRVLQVIVNRVMDVPNKIAISGHTDARQYHKTPFYSNWELSAARALNARRAMEEMHFPAARVERVVGHADRFLISPDNPLDPANRRINILVLREPKRETVKSEQSSPFNTAQASVD